MWSCVCRGKCGLKIDRQAGRTRTELELYKLQTTRHTLVAAAAVALSRAANNAVVSHF